MIHADQDVIPYWTRKNASRLRKSGFVVLLLTLLIGGIPAVSLAQDPGQQQDAEAARVKLLKAADQLDMIETGYETTRVSVDTLKTQVSQLTQSQAQLAQENADLKTQLASIQDELKHSEEVHAAEQKALLAQVAELIASSMSKTKPSHTKASKSTTSGTSTATPTPDPNGPYSPPTSTPVASHLNDNPPDPTLVGSGTDVVQPPAEKTTTPAPDKTPAPAAVCGAWLQPYCGRGRNSHGNCSGVPGAGGESECF